MAVLAQNTITLIRVDDGTDGKGVASITRQYYVSTSKIAPTGGSWTTTAPAWSLGKYLWTRYEIKYTNPSSTVYTTAYCDSSWEAINEIQIGGRNYFKRVANKTGAYAGTFDENYETIMPGYQNDTGSFGQFFNLTVPMSYFVGKSVKLSFDCISPNGSTPIRVYNNNGKPRYYLDHSGLQSPIGTEWVHQELDITITDRGEDYDEEQSNKIEIFFSEQPDCRVRLIKLEIGNKATDWTPAPEDTAMSIDEIHNQLDGIDNIITNTQTNFEQKIDSITATVEQTQQTVVDYQGQLTQIRTDISTEIEQVASGLNLTIEEIYNQFSDLGDVTETIRTFFKVTSDGLMIAQDGNPTSTLMGYDHFAVLLNNTEVVKIYQDSMQAPNGIFDSSVTIGPIKFEGYSEGVALKWVG